MKRLGLLGGMSWESSIEYERIINQFVRRKLGGVASADLIIRSFNFADIEKMQAENDWEMAGVVLGDAAHDLELAGADAIVLCTNTMHAVSDAIESAVSIPLIHIAEATGSAIQQSKLDTVALLGTRYTMEKEFYAGRIRDKFQVNVIIPNERDRATIHDVIYSELVQGVINSESRYRYQEIIQLMVAQGAQGIIAGCTEIELLLSERDVPVPYFPTTHIHATAAAAFTLTD